MNNKKPLLIETEINQPIPEEYTEISERDAVVLKDILSKIQEIHTMIEEQYKEYGFENKRN
jgi:hypothetical protein